jgi:hypothetical protein
MQVKRSPAGLTLVYADIPAPHGNLPQHSAPRAATLTPDDAEALVSDLTPTQRNRLALGHTVTLPVWLADAFRDVVL